LPTTSSDLTREDGRAALNLLLFGLAPGGVYHAVSVTRNPVRSYRTLSPLPTKSRRSTLCGTFPQIALAGRYPAPCPIELGLSSNRVYTLLTITQSTY